MLYIHFLKLEYGSIDTFFIRADSPHLPASPRNLETDLRLTMPAPGWYSRLKST
jgi:hypothetical protein